MNQLVMVNTIVIFMDGALVKVTDIQDIEKQLNSKKEELNLNGEIKWTKVTGNYLDKSIFLFYKIWKNKI